MNLATKGTSEARKRGSWLLGRDLVGHKWGKMEVIAQAERPEGNEVMFRGTWWLCRCECGKEKVLPRQYITAEQVKSCGCGYRQTAKEPEPEEKAEELLQYSPSVRNRLTLMRLRKCLYFADLYKQKGQGIFPCLFFVNVL